MIRTLFYAAAAFLVLGCASSGTYNATVFPYEMDEAKLADHDLNRVVIAHVNLGGPSRNYLQEIEPRVDRAVADYLEEHGMKVIPGRRFEQEWKTALRIYGNPYDPSTGRLNQKTFALCLLSVRDAISKSQNLDGIIFTDILEREIAFSGGLKHMARWDGVSRKPSLQGPGEGVSADFDWNKEAHGASLWVSVYNMDLNRVFTSIGGLDTTEAIDTRSSSGRYIRRRSILENETHIREGIELAFHPFIEMKNYPGEKPGS
jgi:hypothetical protein